MKYLYKQTKTLGCNIIRIRKSSKQINEFYSVVREINKTKKIGLDLTDQIDSKNIQNQIPILQKILNEIKFFDELNYVYDFFEISIVNFSLPCDEHILKQGFQTIKEQNLNYSFCKFLKNIFYKIKSKKKNVWIIITNQGVGYINKDNFFEEEIDEFCFFKSFIEIRLKKTPEFTIQFEQNKIKFCFVTHFDAILFLNQVCQSYDQNKTKNIYRYDSFSEICEYNFANFYINGFTEPNYFSDVYDCLNRAQQYVLITDWFLSPLIYLKRPQELHQETQLKTVLKNIAQKGVKIFILLYQENPIALPNNSAQVEIDLEKINNVVVVRHPNSFLSFWSHHEKSIIIDNQTLFMGGLDLCYGRYEANDYLLKEPDDRFNIWPGEDYYNIAIEEISKFQYSKDKNKFPRSPWRDQAIKVTGPIVQQITNHFRQYWEYAILQNDRKQNLNKKALQKQLKQVQKDLHKIDSKHCGYHLNQYRDNLKVIEDKLQKELKNFQPRIKKNPKIEHNQRPSRLYVKRDNNQIHDKPMYKIVGTSLHDKKENFDEDISQNVNSIEYEKYIDFFQTINQPKQYYQTLCSPGQQQEENFTIQALRSASAWSIGLHKKKSEKSIYNAYLNLIENSEKFIYIENQFFISDYYTGIDDQFKQKTQQKDPKNQIIITIAKRIIKAINNKENFLVFIVIPLLPGFSGNITKKDGDILRIQLDLCMKTLITAQNSLINIIQQHDSNWEKYIKIYGMRNHTVINNKPVTSQIYIHSKVMIIDDTKLIIGSANINDRSMWNDRDSELALIIENNNTDSYQGILDGQQFHKSKQITEYRINCIKSIFQMNLNYEDMLDPILQQQLKQQAEINDNFYFQTFKCYPSNNFATLDDIRKVENEDVNTEFYYQNKEKVIGYAVIWPTNFLHLQQNFVNENTSYNSFVPLKIFT